MTLNEVMKETADAIREKTGKSELIKPVDFAEEIKGITAGGSGESGGGNYIYYDQTKTDMNYKFMWEYASSVKVSANGMTAITTPMEAYRGNMSNYIVAACLDVELKISNTDDPNLTLVSLGEYFSPEIDTLPRITKEEYYNLE